MRLLLSSSLLFAGLVDLSAAWSLSQPQYVTRKHQRSTFRPAPFTARGRALSMQEPTDIHEFDFLLHENDIASESLQGVTATTGSRRAVKLGGGEGKVVMASSTAVASTQEELQSSEATEGESAEESFDPYSEMDYQQQMGRIQVQEQKLTMEDRLKQMDLQDIIVTLFIPAVVSFVGLRWGFNKVASRVSDNADTLLDSFANEMIYHDGNEAEMRMCHADYSRQLLWLGPRKGDAMIKRYIAAYAKKKTVSPQSIRTLSYVFALFKLSEDKAAEVLVSLCREMGTDKISSAGKILFFGSRILKSPEGVKGLEPIKDLIKSTYRDATVAETLVETSQQAIGEAAYRTVVQSGGKKQKKLTVGWEILGLDKASATRIFEEEAKEGFVSARETMYGQQTRKYDKKGRPIDKEGKLENPEDAEDDDDEDSAPPSNVYRCGDCGYTLFIAKGREFKFFGDDFKCPECGAKKDKFEPADLEEP